MRRLTDILRPDDALVAGLHHAEAQARAVRPLTRAERVSELVAGVAFLLAVVLLSLAPHDGVRLPAPVVLALVVAFAAVSRTRFPVGTGFTTPGQLLIVPLAFALPPALLPVAIAVGLVLAELPDVTRGRRPAGRLVLAPGNALFAVGPAAVLALAGTPTAAAVAPLVAVAALLAQALTDIAASAVRERIMHGDPLREQLRDVAWVHLVDALLAPIGFAAAVAMVDRPWAALLPVTLAALLRLFATERAARLDQMVELGAAYRGTAVLLGDVVEADHEYTGSHSQGVVDLAVAVADRLGLGPVQRRDVEFGALLHDVGKIRIPKAIIDKPGPLDEDEWALMRTHTIEGEAMLRKVGGVLEGVGRVVRASHERFDGRGYPDGLAGEDIPLEARIITACDAYSAMTTDRAYRAARSVAEAVTELRDCAGTQFDPVVVDALVAVAGALGTAQPARAPVLAA